MKVTIEREYYANRFKIVSKKGTCYLQAFQLPLEVTRFLDTVVEESRKQKRALRIVQRYGKREERLRAKIEKGRAKLDRKRQRL